MSKYAHITAAGGANAVNFLNQCVMRGCTDYVFEYLNTNYNLHPSKKKAIAIYGVFIKDGTSYQLNCNELLGPSARIHRLIEFYQESAAMNIFQRVALKGLRAADKNIFNEFLPAAFRQEDTAMMDGCVKGGAIDPAAMSSANKSMYRSWIDTRKVLVAAGFDCIRST